jgi:hypothetical protein
MVELYDLEDDPEELTDLSKTHQTIVSDLLEELNGRINSADAPYR